MCVFIETRKITGNEGGNCRIVYHMLLLLKQNMRFILLPRGKKSLEIATSFFYFILFSSVSLRLFGAFYFGQVPGSSLGSL